MVDRGAIELPRASLLSYLSSIAVKDFEVSTLLRGSGLCKDQVAFYLDEMGGEPVAPQDLIAFAGELKVVLGAHPFRDDDQVLVGLETVYKGLGVFQNATRDIASYLAGSPELGLEDKMEGAFQRLAPLVVHEE
jgi:hypothetical protein